MFRKIFTGSTALFLIFILSACTSVQLPWVSGRSAQNPGLQQVKDKLAIGILKLEDTNLSVSSTQARDLLFLWKGIKVFNSDENITPREIAAVYDQMQGVLTPQQVQAIKDMNITREDINSLMKKYGVVNSAPPPSSTKKTTSSSSGGGNPMMGGPMGGPMGGSSRSSNSTNTETKKTRPQGNTQTDYNFLFSEPLIKVLIQRAGNPQVPPGS
jgi:hypothetical protein